jgi:hypothetical protein
MADAAYFRAWRAAHPDYRARQNQIRNERRRRQGRGDRSAEYAHRRARATATATQPIPDLHHGHDLFEEARRIVGPRRTSLVVLYDPLYDDLLSEATLALIEGRDPQVAVQQYGTRERSYSRVTCPLFEAA